MWNVSKNYLDLQICMVSYPFYPNLKIFLHRSKCTIFLPKCTLFPPKYTICPPKYMISACSQFQILSTLFYSFHHVLFSSDPGSTWSNLLISRCGGYLIWGHMHVIWNHRTQTTQDRLQQYNSTRIGLHVLWNKATDNKMYPVLVDDVLTYFATFSCNLIHIGCILLKIIKS